LQFLAYIIIYPILWIISILPFRLLYMLSDGVYVLLYYVIGYRKKVVKDNLKLVFPEKNEQEIKQISKKFYHHFCDMMFEAIKSLTISEKQILRRFKITNIEEIKQYEKANKSVIFLCGHYASWEWAMSIQKHINFTGYGVYKRLRNPYFDRLVKRVRGRYNSYLIDTKETISTLVKSKENGKLFLCGMVADQSPKLKKAHHWTEFMGVKVPCFTGAELITKRLNLPLLFLEIKKVKRGFYEATFSTITKTPKDFKDYELTDMFHKLVERQIKKAPQFYLWTHKRWKHKDNIPEEFK